MPRMGRPRVENKKEKRITIRFNDEQISRLEAYADEHHLKKAQVLMKAFEEMLERDAKKEK